MNNRNLSRAVWRKSTRSNGSANCVEVRRWVDDIQVRDSKNPDGHVLTFSPSEWNAFIGGAKDGEFNL